MSIGKVLPDDNASRAVTLKAHHCMQTPQNTLIPHAISKRLARNHPFRLHSVAEQSRRPTEAGSAHREATPRLPGVARKRAISSPATCRRKRRRVFDKRRAAAP